MAQIHFQEICELYQKALGEDQDNIEENPCKGEGTCAEDNEKVIAEALGLSEELLSDALEIIEGISGTLSDGMSAAFAYLDGVLYARIYDGEKYVFPLPFILSEDADAEGACINLAEYSVRELIPLIITDVPRDELEFLLSIFPHVDAFTYEDDDDSFYIKVNNECDMLDSVPVIKLDGITLDELRDTDKEKYAELCRDRDLNKYWGYDVDADNPDGNADFYLDTARREMDDGVAIALAIREGDELVVRCSPVKEIVFFSDAVWSARVFVGDGLTEARYTPRDFETFIRAEITDADGKRAWSCANPLKEAVK